MRWGSRSGYALKTTRIQVVVLNLEARTLEEQISEGVSMVFGRRNA